ncbi:MAG: helix-turn-helix domain-containing protein [Salinimicrobium sp.]
MARKVDQEKLSSIKAATMKVIVDHGVEGATVAMIANEAKVSGGYLYRIYESKQDLIKELFYEKVKTINSEITELLETNKASVVPVIRQFITGRINYAQKNPLGSKFYYLLIHNDNFLLPDELREELVEVMEEFKATGVAAGEINPSASLLEFYFHMIVYVLDYIHFKTLSFLGSHELSERDIDYLTSSILQILKQTAKPTLDHEI